MRAHHDRVGKAPHQHDKAEHDVHDADALMVGRSQIFVPQIRPRLDLGDPCGDCGQREDDDDRRDQRDRLLKRDRAPGQLAERLMPAPGGRAVMTALLRLRRAPGGDRIEQTGGNAPKVIGFT